MDSDEDSSAPGAYNDGNRAFMQSFLARGSLTFKEGQQLLAAIFTIQEGKETRPEDVTEADFKSYVDAAAAALSSFDYEIRTMKHQGRGTMVWSLVNFISDPLTQYATTHTMEEIYFLKRLLDAMFETYNTQSKEVMAITSIQALKGPMLKGVGQENGVNGGGSSTQIADKGLTKDQAAKTLQSLVQEGWLETSKEGYHTLSSRALMELRGWLVDTYNDSDDPGEWQRIKFCEACKGIITIGQRCSKKMCNVRLHNICQVAYWNSRPSKKCAKCETPWNGTHFVGQRAETSTEKLLKEKRRSVNDGVYRTRRNTIAEEDESNTQT